MTKQNHPRHWRHTLARINILFIILIIITTFSTIQTAYAIDVGILPFEVAINQVTDKVYVCHADGTVRVFNTDGTPAVPPIILVSLGDALTGITVNPITDKIYVTNSAKSSVVVIDGGTSTIDTEIFLVDGFIPLGIFPVDVEVNTNFNIIYVSSVLLPSVVAINGTTNAIIDPVLAQFDSPSRFTFDPDTDLMYMTNIFGAKVSVIDTDPNSGTFNTVIDTINVGNGPDGIEINPDTDKIYTANSADNTVSVIDAGTGDVTETIPVGVDPVGVGIFPDGVDSLIFISNRADGTLSVINGTTDDVVNLIPTDIFDIAEPFPPRPRGVDVDLDDGDIFVVNGYSGLKDGTLSILDLVDNPPVANAGPDQVVKEGDLVTLNGTVSSDPDDDALLHAWTQIDLGTPVALAPSSFSPIATFTAPLDNADRLVTFSLVVSDDGFTTTSIPDIVNIVIKDETTFTVSTTVDDGVVSGSQTIEDIFSGSTYSLNIDTSEGDLPFGELEQLVIPSGVDASDVTIEFIESPERTFTTRHIIGDGALYFDLNFDGVDYSTSSNFLSGIPPKVQFLVDCSFGSSERFADGSPVIPVFVFDEDKSDWELIGDPQKPNTNKIYVSNGGANTLSVIDGTTNDLIKTIGVGLAPQLVDFDQTTNRIYVANQGDGTVSVIDGFTNSVIDTVPVGVAPIEPVVNPNTGLVYVTNQGDGTVSVINGSTNTVIATIDTENITPTGIDVDTSLNKIYVANNFASNVTVIDGDPSSGTFNTVIGGIPAPQPSGLEIDSDNNRAYVSNFNDRAVTVIHTGIDAIVGFISVGPGPVDLSFNPTTNRLYVANTLTGSVSIVDTTIGAQVTTLPVPTGSGAFGVDVNPNTNRAYVSNRGSGTVSVIDGMPGSPTENTVIDTIPGFSNNFGVAVNADVPNPVRDPSTDVGDQCSYIAQPPHFSKFSVGGSRALALGGSGILTGTPPILSLDLILSNNSFEFPSEIEQMVSNHDPLVPITSIYANSFGGFDFPLSINGNGYALSGFSNTIETYSTVVGKDVEIKLTFYEYSELAHFSLYLNLRGDNSGDLSKSDTQILYYMGKPLEIIDPNELIETAQVTVTNDEDSIKKFVTIELSFSNSMETSDFVIRAWDDRLNSRDTIVYEAIEILDSFSEFQGEILEDSEVETLTTYVFDLKKELILQWAGYKQYDLSDEEFLDQLNVQGEFLPLWVKENFGKWVYEGQVESNEVVQAIKYLEKIGITI